MDQLSHDLTNIFSFFFLHLRAKNARAKAEAAELATKQARIDSEIARMRAHEVAPDFIQPGKHF